MLGLGPKELIISALISALLFGSKRIPELVHNIGEAVRQLKKGFSGEDKYDKDDKEDKTD